MSLARLRLGEWVTLAGALGLLVTMFFDWFGVEGDGRLLEIVRVSGLLEKSGWSGVGWALAALLALAIALGLAIVVATATRQTPAWSVGACVLAVPVGLIAFLVLALRLLTQPGLGVGLPDEFVDIKLAAHLGLLFTALIPVGAFLALKDERTAAPESAYTPPPARPVPGT